MKHDYKTLSRLIKKPIFHAAEARKAGIHPSRLSYYVKTRLIERIAHGVYRGTDAFIDIDFRWEDLIMTAKSIPNSVICLVSALSIYELTDLIPKEHWIAVSHSTSAPKRVNTRIVRMRDMTTGKSAVTLGKITVTIFDRERTILDAFRYLSREVAIKALKMAARDKDHRLDFKKLQKYAKQFGHNLDPYILTVTT